MRIVFLSFLVLLMSATAVQAQLQKSFRKQLLEEIVREHTRVRPPAHSRAVEEALASRTDAGHNEDARKGRAVDTRASDASASVPLGKAVDEWVETLVSDDLYPESEVHAVVNPANQKNFVASPIRQQVYQGQIADLTCPIYYTLDDGASWQLSSFRNDPEDPSAITVGGGDPVLAADADGTLYFSWLAFYMPTSFDRLISELYWVYSTDGGISWVRPEKDVIAKATMPLNGTVQHFVDKQWLAVDRSTNATRGSLYAGYLRVMDDRMHIAVRRKVPGSLQFDIDEVFVSPPDTHAIVQFTNIDVDPSGGVHVTWFGSADEQHFSLWHALSTDGGATFPTVTKISDIVFPKYSIEDRLGEIPGMSYDRIYPSPQSCADRGAHPGYMYITWAASGIDKKEGNGTDIYFSRSTDNGMTWQAPFVVNDDEKGIVRDQFHPSIAVNEQGVVAITWYDRREDEKNESARYYIAVSRDGGTRFLHNRPVAAVPMDMYKAGEDNGAFGIGEYTQVILTETEAIPFWSDGRTNDGNIDIYSARLGLATLDVKQMSPLVSGFRIVDAWPTPARRQLQLRVAFDQAMEVTITASDLLGRKLHERSTRYERGTHDLTFDVAAFATGSYQVVIQAGSGIATRLVQIVR
ncbi:MAG: hypothetical protein IH600_06550 [Bacteroidetes bacterium]|nr:hypothetical protein [Bacteroidota bacterium]